MEISNWKYYTVSELFSSFERGKVHSQNTLPEGDDYFYVGAKKEANGVMCRCGYDANLVSKGNCLVFICNGAGSVGYCNYMDRDFMASGDLIMAYADFLNPRIGLFLASLLDLERPKYSFGRKYGSHVKTTKVLLPTKDGTPDWQYMETFIKDRILPQLPKKAQKVWLQKYDIKPHKLEAMKLNTDEWEWFYLKDLFSVKRGERLTIPNREEGIRPLVTAGEENTGVAGYISNNVAIYKDAITIDMFGYTCYRGYQFSCDDNILVLTNKNLNEYNGIFVATIINRDKYKFAYGRQYRQKNFIVHKIKLPVTPSGEPDWQFMEDYIKSLPYSKNLEPSDPNEVVDELMEVKKRVIEMERQMKSMNGATTVNIYGEGSNYYDQSKHITIN